MNFDALVETDCGNGINMKLFNVLNQEFNPP